MLVIRRLVKHNFYHFVIILIVKVPRLNNGFRTSTRLPSDELMVHRDTPDNNPSTDFEFTPENIARIEALVRNYPARYGRSAPAAMHRVAAVLRVPKMRAYEFATFYTIHRRRNIDEYRVQVCVTTPCMLMAGDELLAAAEKGTCARAGAVSADGLFGVIAVQCQGACANAPVLVVNNYYSEDVTTENVRAIIQKLKQGEIPPPGPQNGRYAAEPLCGLTSLASPLPGPVHMLQEALKCSSAKK